MKLTYGNGNLWTQPGTTHDGYRCICIRQHNQGHPVGSVPNEWDEGPINEEEIDVILEFKSIEAARTLQDELNELIAKWSKDEAPRI